MAFPNDDLRTKMMRIEEYTPWQNNTPSMDEIAREEYGQLTNPIHTINVGPKGYHPFFQDHLFEHRRPPVLDRETSADARYRHQYGVYDEIFAKDDQVFNALMLRANVVLNHPLAIVVDPKYAKDPLAEKQRRFVEEVLQGLGSSHYGSAFKSHMLLTLITGLGWGFSVSEILWRRRADGKVIIIDLKHRHPRHFKFAGDHLRFLSMASPWEGDPVEPSRIALFRPNGMFGNPYGDPLLEHCYFWSRFKTINFRELNEFAKRYGMPMIEVRNVDPKNDMTPAEVAVARSVMSTLKYGPAIINAHGWIIKPLEFNQPDSVEVFDKIHNLCNTAIAKIIVANPGILDAADANKSSLDVGLSLFHDLIYNDGEALKKWVQHQIVNRLIDLNWGATSRRYPIVHLKGLDNRDSEQRAKDFLTAAELGVELSKNQIRETLALQEPLNPDDVAVLTPQGSEMAKQVNGRRGPNTAQEAPVVNRNKTGGVEGHKKTQPIARAGSERGRNEDTGDYIANA